MPLAYGEESHPASSYLPHHSAQSYISQQAIVHGEVGNIAFLEHT
ncbi:hypothetical protein HMPREF6745_0073 [Prevotella sp. oral taxon 472 str. F0295]|nr:hypothetical protein HMPREF6745_0073 [Prevotella sp. oral taxon 472 str. F0295]